MTLYIFLGRHLTGILIDNGWKVTAGIHANTENIPPGAESKSLNCILNEAVPYDVVFFVARELCLLRIEVLHFFRA